ncbi:MAG: hypothetical protein BWY27_00112 [Bacteroidetes bacterium ADurb.Bin234]|nr:MAG: hypothetical protein BWY27_00112 [Bacteroidetes bacterium ADurb.Bin234]
MPILYIFEKLLTIPKSSAHEQQNTPTIFCIIVFFRDVFTGVSSNIND